MIVRFIAVAAATSLVVVSMAQTYVSGHYSKNGTWIPGHYRKTAYSPTYKPLRPLQPLGGRSQLRRNNTYKHPNTTIFFYPLPSSARQHVTKPFWSDVSVEVPTSRYSAPIPSDSGGPGILETPRPPIKPPAPEKTSVYVRFTSDSKVIITGSSDSQFAYGDRIISIKEGYDSPVSTYTAEELHKFLRSAKSDIEAIVRVERNGRYLSITVASLRVLALEL